MKVLHINSYYSDHGKPAFFRNFFNAQVEQGLDISVYVPVDHYIDTTMQEKFGGYSILAKTHKPLDRWFYPVKQGKILRDAKNRFSKGRFDLIHSHSLFTNGYVAWKLSEVLGVPFVTAVRNTDISYFFRYMPHLRKTGLGILLKADRIIFISKPHLETLAGRYLPENLRTQFLEKAEVIGNGIDGYWLKNRVERRRKPEGKNLNLLTVGKIISRKNHLTTARAAEFLIKRGFSVNLTVVGEEQDERILRKLREYPFVRYLSPVPKEELLEIYREADIFVLPSITETFGLVYPEAMSQGLPVIYSRGQGFDGQFEEGTVGFHTESKNAEEIADRIVDITRNYANISRNCVEMCKRFNWTDIAGEYDRVYEKILTTREEG
ncbi:MAG TPA: glycosyltransferase family 4 protein [Synergistales bacterium]|nr:glycosyltransferase family 4 protein [Synergistales bacterium]